MNGGQTTASIFYSSKRDVDISDVKVQMKLTVVEDKKSQEIVPKISEYANSQNKVNKADFFSNHPFHRVFKKLSDLKSAPPAPGSNQITYWFYERVRVNMLKQSNQNQSLRGKHSIIFIPENNLLQRQIFQSFLIALRVIQI